MKTFSVVAKNDQLKQTNEVCNFEYAVEMYRYLTVEADFPNVYLMDNETGEVLLSRVVETTITEYVSPTLLADTPEEPDEETAEEEKWEDMDFDFVFEEEDESEDEEEWEDMDFDIEEESDEETALRFECEDLIVALLTNTDVPTMVKEQLDRLDVDNYTFERLQNLKTILKNLLEKY